MDVPLDGRTRLRVATVHNTKQENCPLTTVPDDKRTNLTPVATDHESRLESDTVDDNARRKMDSIVTAPHQLSAMNNDQRRHGLTANKRLRPRRLMASDDSASRRRMTDSSTRLTTTKISTRHGGRQRTAEYSQTTARHS